MARTPQDDDENENYYSEERETSRSQKRAKAKKSGFPTWLWVVLGVFGTFGLICCGGAFYIGRQIQQTIVQTPAEINALRDQMVSIEVPPGLNPAMGMSWDIGISMKLVVYGSAAAGQGPQAIKDGSTLMLMSMSVPGQPQQVNQQQMEQQMRQQKQGRDVTIREREDRTFTIQGQEVSFQFAKGQVDANGQQVDVRQVTGVVTGKTAPVMVIYIVPEEDWDEDTAVKMIESIGK